MIRPYHIQWLAAIAIVLSGCYSFTGSGLPAGLRTVEIPSVIDNARQPELADQATKAIVDEGPFARSRNPVYIGFAIIQVGIGVWTDKLAVVLLVVVPVVMTAALVVPREEDYLRRKFGAVYEDYCSRVRRWL